MTSKSMLSKNTSDRFRIEVHCTDKFFNDTEDKNAASILANKSQLSKQKIKNLMQQGAVWLHRGKDHKRIRKANLNIQKGDRLELFYDQYLQDLKTEEPVLLEDLGSYSIWFKPYGVLSQGTQWGDQHSLLRFAELNLKPQRQCFLVHRLDREACGLMLIAHNKKAAGLLSEIFAQRQVEKHYLAVVKGKSKEPEFTVDSPVDEKSAISHFKLLNYNQEKDTSLLEVSIETGRKHQIRVHLNGITLPIIGDSIYGKKVAKENMMLCAISLKFQCPLTKKEQVFKLPEKYTSTFI